MTGSARQRLWTALAALAGFAGLGLTVAAQPAAQPVVQPAASQASPPAASPAVPPAAAETAPPPAAAVPSAPVDASSPVLKKDSPRFLQLHEGFVRRGREAPIGLLFLGDSITEKWATAPSVWKQHYWRYAAANFGIGGDTTQNVIWRIENGELDGIEPRVVVFMLGTNNTASHTADQIAAADRKIVGMIRERIPGAKVLVLAIFPRGPRRNTDGTADDGVKRMEIIRAVNRDLAGLDDGRNIRFLDIGGKFLGPDGTIPQAVMPDQLHPSAAGYAIWAEAMQPLLDEMMR